MNFERTRLVAVATVGGTGRCFAGLRQQCGFTLIELIMVMIILSVLAVFAAPKIFNSVDFYARGFHDETLSILRYAQKAAVAQRRTVCVSLSLPEPATVKLSIASEPAPGGCDISLTGPSVNCSGGPTISGFPNDKQGCITARSGVWYDSSSPDSVTFNGLGQSVDASTAAVTTQTIKINTAEGVWGNSILVEGETGYVHD